MMLQTPVTGMARTLHGLKTCGRSLAGLWERLSLYLPLALMGLLAVGTYWLVRNTPAAYEAEAARPVSHELDYFMRRATVKTFDDKGHLKTEIFGTEARHFQDTETLEIDQARMRSTGPDGRLTTAAANRALSNDAGSEVQLLGKAVVVREPMQTPDGSWLPRLEFTGEFLHVFVNEDRVKSHLPVVLKRGSDVFSGDTFAYDNLDQVADLKGRVKGLLVPKATAGSALTNSQPRQ
jgi:lipopolysaccharide export system protein LptC